MRTRGWQGDLPQDSDEARARILAAAASCVERYGAQKTRLADVASELGVTRQTVYRYYSSVDEMLVAVATAGTADFLDRMAVALSDVHTPQDAITETIIYCLRVLPDEPMIAALPVGHALLQGRRKTLRLTDLRDEWFILTPRPIGAPAAALALTSH